jgi:hypothetical protein
MLGKIGELRHKVGDGLSRFALKTYAGGAEPETVDQATVSTVFQKLTDLGNGVDRLQRAAAAVGDARYSIICRELNLASESINDIPDRDALQRLLARAESEAAGKNGHGGNGSASTRKIADARGHLLQAARQVADKTSKRLADIIAEASDGKLSLDGLKDLTDADITLVSAAMSRMV